jgi:hypothetical protein
VATCPSSIPYYSPNPLTPRDLLFPQSGSVASAAGSNSVLSANSGSALLAAAAAAQAKAATAAQQPAAAAPRASSFLASSAAAASCSGGKGSSADSAAPCASPEGGAAASVAAHSATSPATAAAPLPLPPPPAPVGGPRLFGDTDPRLLSRLFWINGKAAFDRGTVLGVGGQGEVRRCMFQGVECAIKNSDGSGAEEAIGERLPCSPWVQTPLVSTVFDDGDDDDGLLRWLMVYELAGGDLQQAIWGLQWSAWAAAQGKQQPAADHKTTTNHNGSSSIDDPAAVATAAPKRWWDRLAAPLRRRVVRRPQAAAAALPTSTATQRPAARQPLLPLSAFRAVAAQTAVPIQQLHQAGFRHCDVKPANYLVTKGNHLRLADLGCSGTAYTSAVGNGTHMFMAPEQRSCEGGSARMADIKLRLVVLGEILGWHRRVQEEDSRPVDMWALAVTWLSLLSPSDDELVRVVKQLHTRLGQRWWQCLTPQLQRQRSKGWQPPAWVPAELTDLLFGGMLVPQKQRLTIEGVQAHSFFQGVDWAALEEQAAPLPVDLLAKVEAGRTAVVAGAAKKAAAAAA